MYRSFNPPPPQSTRWQENQQPYMYPPRPYPPSIQPYPSQPSQQQMVFPTTVPKQKGTAVKSLMNGFMDQNGQIDVQKTMSTVDTAMKTYQQVSPMIKQLTSFFTTRP